MSDRQPMSPAQRLEWWWAFFAAQVLCTLIVGLFAYNAYSWHKIIEGGYEETMLIGSGQAHWTKSRPTQEQSP